MVAHQRDAAEEHEFEAVERALLPMISGGGGVNCIASSVAAACREVSGAGCRNETSVRRVLEPGSICHPSAASTGPGTDAGLF